MAIPTGPIPLTGRLVNEDGSPANGILVFQLNTFASVLPSAGGPLGITPHPLQVPVVSGVVNPGSTIEIYGNDALEGVTWYSVKFINSAAVIEFVQNWLITGDGPFDCGAVTPYTTTGVTFPSMLSIIDGQFVLEDTAVPGQFYRLVVTNGEVQVVPIT